MTQRFTHDVGLFGGIETDSLKVAGASILPFLTGKSVFCDPANGSDLLSGRTLAQAMATLPAAYALMRAGKNDHMFLVGNGQASGAARLTENFAWDKHATHLIGISAPTRFAARSRIAPTLATAAFANLFTVSVDGCIFSNIHSFHGFDTGTTSQICWTDEGRRNYYENCHIGGMGDAEAAADAGSRSLLLGGSGGKGENTFYRCTIGLDTIQRSVVNASLEFQNGTPRNLFSECIFPVWGDAGQDQLIILVDGANAVDRYQFFERCLFYNVRQSGADQAAVATFTSAAANGDLIFKDCTRIRITDWGTDPTSLAQIFVGGASAGSTNHAGDDVGRGIVAISS
jgi:hypothetical protein